MKSAEAVVGETTRGWALTKRSRERLTEAIRAAQDEAFKAGAASVSQWRTMEDAPRDGTHFRAGYWIDNKFYQFDCFFGVKHHRCESEYCDSDWHDEEFGYQEPAFRCAMFEEQMKPTHWMPHPTPPTGETK